MRAMIRLPVKLASVALVGLLLLSTITLLGACNTTAGVGQDVSAAGRAVSNSAEKVKQGL
jgi:predicted small secreted protein